MAAVARGDDVDGKRVQMCSQKNSRGREASGSPGKENPGSLRIKRGGRQPAAKGWPARPWGGLKRETGRPHGLQH